jgi:hypothetical protein
MMMMAKGFVEDGVVDCSPVVVLFWGLFFLVAVAEKFSRQTRLLAHTLFLLHARSKQ